MIKWCWKEWERRECGDAWIHQGRALGHAGVCCSSVVLWSAQKYQKEGDLGGKLGQKYIRSWKEGWLPKSVVLQLAPSFAPCLSWRRSCKTNIFVLLLFVKCGWLRSDGAEQQGGFISWVICEWGARMEGDDLGHAGWERRFDALFHSTWAVSCGPRLKPFLLQAEQQYSVW